MCASHRFYRFFNLPVFNLAGGHTQSMQCIQKKKNAERLGKATQNGLSKENMMDVGRLHENYIVFEKIVILFFQV